MQLKEGYINTEVGVLPEQWSITQLSKVGSFSKGKGIKKDEVELQGISCVRYGELYTKYDNIITKCNSFINEEVAQESTLIKKGDILFAGSGETREEIGKCAALLSELPTYAGGDIVVLRPKGYNSTYLGYLLNSPPIAKQKAIKGQGDTVVHVYSSGLSQIKIPVPPKPEQQAIATALSEVDTLITNLDKLITKKKAIKQGAMQQLLKSPAQGGKRLPGFDGEWVEGTWEDVLSGFSSGMTPYRGNPEYYKGSIKWITSGELNYNVITDTIEKITEEAVAKTNLKILPIGTFLMAITGLEAAGTRGSCGIVGVESATNQSCMAIFSTPRMSTSYLYHYYLKHGDELAFKYCQGSKQQSYTAKIVKKLPITFPKDIEEQKAIATILADMDKAIVGLETKKSKYNRIKQGMMQELLTGRTRLV